MSRLRVVVPVPALWSLSLDGVPRPVGEWSQVPPGPVGVELRVRGPLAGWHVEGTLRCVVDVSAGADVEVALPASLLAGVT